MYLVDTSVWLDFFRNRATPVVSRFEEILDQGLPFGITGVIYQEVLQGADTEEDFAQIRTYLQTLKFYQPLDAVVSYHRAAGIFFRCRRKGITIRSTIDCLIAQIAVDHRLRLLHNDRDFSQMAKAIPDLKLA